MEKPTVGSVAGFGVRRGNQALLNFLDSWIQARTADRWLPQTYDYWFSGQDWLSTTGERPSRGSEMRARPCAGSGRASETETSYVSTRQRHGDSNFGSVTTTGKRDFSGTAYVEISGSFARVKVPNAMLPTIRGGDDGWFTVKDPFMNDREITGKIKLNALNKPKLRIDRVSGTLSLTGGFSEFNGQCSVQDVTKPKF